MELIRIDGLIHLPIAICSWLVRHSLIFAGEPSLRPSQSASTAWLLWILLDPTRDSS